MQNTVRRTAAASLALAGLLLFAGCGDEGGAQDGGNTPAPTSSSDGDKGTLTPATQAPPSGFPAAVPVLEGEAGEATPTDDGGHALTVTVRGATPEEVLAAARQLLEDQGFKHADGAPPELHVFDKGRLMVQVGAYEQDGAVQLDYLVTPAG